MLQHPDGDTAQRAFVSHFLVSRRGVIDQLRSEGLPGIRS